jgi:adenosylcobinamide-GDP ribazoletransferase
MLRALLLAVGLLSRLPVPTVAVDATALGRSPLWYPWVGLLLGMLASVFALMLQPASALLAAAGYTVALMVLSGGLHLDGLGDTADAWIGGHGDRDRMLQIMKDPRCGPMAVAAIAGVLLFRVAAAHALIGVGSWTMLVCAPALGRAVGAGLLAGVPGARSDGLAAQLQQRLARRGIGVSLLLIALVIAVAAAAAGTVAVLAAGLTALLLGRSFRRRLGGVSGDTVGAAIELSETVALVAAAVWLGAGWPA